MGDDFFFIILLRDTKTKLLDQDKNIYFYYFGVSPIYMSGVSPIYDILVVVSLMMI